MGLPTLKCMLKRVRSPAAEAEEEVVGVFFLAASEDGVCNPDETPRALVWPLCAADATVGARSLDAPLAAAEPRGVDAAADVGRGMDLAIREMDGLLE